MTPPDDARERAREAVREALAGIAPEADPDRLDPARSLRGQLDLDSFDFLHLMIALHERLQVDVPEADYGRVDGLDALLDYLAARLPSTGRPPC